MMFKSFAQPLTGTASIALVPTAAATVTTNFALAPTACSFWRHALAALDTTVALYSCIASSPHAPKGTFILTKIRGLASSYWSLRTPCLRRGLAGSHWGLLTLCLRRSLASSHWGLLTSCLLSKAPEVPTGLHSLMVAASRASILLIPPIATALPAFPVGSNITIRYWAVVPSLPSPHVAVVVVSPAGMHATIPSWHTMVKLPS